MSGNVYEKLQNQLIMKLNRLYVIEVKSVSPILIGGYDGKCYHGKELGFENIRESSIKGVWRWWARAFIAAAIAKKYNRYVSLDVAEAYVSKILGSTKEASRYNIVVFPRSLSKDDYVLIQEYNHIPRIKLLLQKKELQNGCVIKPNIKFKIMIYKNRSTNQSIDEFAFWSLVVSLLFDGIGKACSRGFGKMKILRVYGENVKELNEFLGKLYSSRNINDLKKNFRNIINKTVEKAVNVIEVLETEYVELKNLLDKCSDKPIIEIPLVENNLMIISIPNKMFMNMEEALNAIGKASLKLYHKMLRYVKMGLNIQQAYQRAKRESGKDVHTWILGLPRAQEPLIVEPKGRGVNVLKNKVYDLKNKLEKELTHKHQGILSLYRDKEKKFKELIRIDEKRKRIRIPTGYYYLGDSKRKDMKLRRKSPIRFTIVKTNNSYFIVIYAFKTYDWEQIMGSLIHIGAHYMLKKVKVKGKERIKVVDVKDFNITPIISINIDETFCNIINSVMEIIEKL